MGLASGGRGRAGTARVATSRGAILHLMKDGTEPTPVTSPDDPRLAGMGMEDVAGADQIDGMLAMTPDDRLDSLVAMADFAEQLRHGRIISSKR